MQAELMPHAGRSIAVMPRHWPESSGGYVDFDQDDYDAERNPWMHKMQQDIVKPVRWIQTEVRTWEILVSSNIC
jgi:hypothetical protein